MKTVGFKDITYREALFGMPKTKGNGAKAREKNKKAPGKPYEVPTPRPSVSQKDADQDELYTCDKCKGSSEYVLQCECCCS